MSRIYLLDIKNLSIEDSENIKDKKREEFVFSINEENRRKQSFFVWKLLEYALNDIGVKSFSFDVDNGRWFLTNNEVYFSLSHSFDMVVVAISSDFIGVDIEIVSDKLLKLQKRYLNGDKEKVCIKSLAECFTKEEAHFKAQKVMDNKTFFVKDNSEREYCLSVSTNEEIELIKIDKL